MLLGIDSMVLCSTHFAPRTFHRSNSSHGLPPAQTVELSESKREVSAPVEGGLDHRVEQVIYCARDCDHDSGVLAAGPITMLSMLYSSVCSSTCRRPRDLERDRPPRDRERDRDRDLELDRLEVV